ncbi:hypothetical protein [Klebsiella michiganensis]|uniref:hypothetical protein n=1 Tax=Klebsiella michiganensis TaxID=1134687 RepID=UPI000665DBAB|nr:hypothetical protein [Klebsiella michiganensis]MBA8305693.1 hypothetical protein [Klebsiella michiganensis]MDH1342698.1 hypothetical protein [Klebsiella michiganensis]MDU4798565.1 hypothetical protein [Klebsiella michiganensis]QLP35288.1 hypothetical protein HVX57_07215 [Klebsiella michiganensis]WFX48929.1 hypothetical protein NFK05_07230 [Klebsiella michiganensis]
MYFFQKDKTIHQYICQHKLWVLGRVVDLYNSNANKEEKMLEPLWRRYHEGLEGIMVFFFTNRSGNIQHSSGEKIRGKMGSLFFE